MNRKLTILVIALSLAAATTQARAQMRKQDERALHLIGAAIGGGVFGVAGVLTRFAIEDARERRDNEASMRSDVSASPAHIDIVPNEDRSGVRYNKPCSSFDPVSGRLQSCDVAFTTQADASLAEHRLPTTQARSYAPSPHAPHSRVSRVDRHPRVHVRAGRIAHNRTVHVVRGGQR